MNQTIDRRSFLGHASAGVAWMAACELLLREGIGFAQESPSAARNGVGVPGAGGLHHPAVATRVIHIFLGGGLSHLDSFDYKPELEKFHDRDLPASIEAAPFMGKAGKLHRPHFEFKQRGQSGLWVSELFPHLAQRADELTVIRSMVAETANHIPGIFQAQTGFRQMGFPAMGAWLSFGLGSLSENLPSFIVLPDARGIPADAGGSFNWSSGFLPAQHQGVAFNTNGPPILDLQPAGNWNAEVQADRLKVLQQLNQSHLEEHSQADALVARMKSYQLAAKMQAEVPAAMDLSAEPEHVTRLYGLDREECRDMAKNCLAARRLIERGVRMVQIWSGDGVSWDSHDDVTGTGHRGHLGEARRIDQPVAALIQDLKQSGLLDSTLVMITTEFGRTPYAQADSGKLSRGRDHHPEAFTNIVVGGGFRPGITFGETDEIGYHPVAKPMTTYDLHATILHQLGIDHERLTYYHNGIQRRLTNVHGHVVHELLESSMGKRAS